MRKDIKTNKVVKALAIGLAASMAMSQPISVMAEEAPVEPNEGGEGTAVVEKVEMAKVEASTICDDAQAAVENAQEVVAVVPESEKVVSDLNSIEGKLEETEMDIVVANGTNAAADKMVDETKKAELEAGAIADEMQAIVDDTDAIADEKIDDIKTATSIADANAANAELVAAVEAAEEKLADRTAAYDAAVVAYNKAVAEVKALEEAYNAAVANATEDAAAAAEKLEVAKQKALVLADEAKLAQEKAEIAKADAEKAKADALTALEEADKALGEAEKAQKDAADAKVKVDEDATVQSGLAIAEKETLTSEDNGRVWENQDQLFAAIMQEYYLPKVKGITGETSVVVTKFSEDDSKNYFTVTYVDEAGETQTVYYNYKMDKDENGVESKDKIVIFEKRPVEVNGDPSVNPDQYVDEEGNVIALADIQSYINVEGTYYEANGVTASNTLISNSDITTTSTSDVTVDETTKKETYKIDETTGELVKEVTADVTTITYTNATFESTEKYATDADRDKAAAEKEAALEKETGKDATVVETSETTYTATGTYIPTFQQQIDVDTWHEDFAFKGGMDTREDVFEETVEDFAGDDYYVIDASADLSSEKEWGWQGIYGQGYDVTGTVSVTYAKVTKDTVDVNTLGAMWNDFIAIFGGKSTNEKLAAEAKKAVEAAGGIFLGAEWIDGNWDKAVVRYVAGVAVENVTKEESAEKATKATEDAALAQAKANGAAGVYNVKTADAIATTTYSYAVNYLEKGKPVVAENQLVATETYGNAEVLTGQIVQNKNYKDGIINLTQDDEAYRAFVDTAVKTNAEAIDALDKANTVLEEVRKLTQEAKDNHIEANKKFDAAEKELAAAQKLTAESVEAANAVLVAQAEVEKLQEAVKKMEGAGSNAQELADLAKDLEAAEAAKVAAEEAFEEVQDKLEEALDELAKTIDRLTPDPVDDDDDDDEEEVVVETPVVVAEPAPVAVQTVVAVEPTVEEPVVEITENEVPLAEEIEETKEEVQEEAPVVIEEEDVPLAAAPVDAEDGMSWWWLLVVVVLGATGAEMYRRHKNKKAEAMEKKSDK